ncbi:MAG TPA: hypothetical protein VJU84_21375 [Pyrinomonadaceae bacterium]|nr:hypothetical protein [Pyrinomonadaceae bacterium]
MSPGVSKAIFSLLAAALILIGDSYLVSAQSGCAVLNKDEPAQSLSFERIEGTTPHPSNVLLSFRI